MEISLTPDDMAQPRTTKFTCLFMFYNERMTTTIPHLHAAKDGFWINQSLKYTVGDDAIWWIPPSQVVFVKRSQC